MTASLPATAPSKSTAWPLANSMLNKLTSSFTSRQHAQIKHEIQLDEPFKVFLPGDLVKGAVHLDINRAIRATHLVVRLHGLVKVVTHSRKQGEPIAYDEHFLNSTRCPTGKRRRGGEYFGNGFARLFEDEHVLCGDGRLIGQYRFRFDMRMPQRDIPSSIDFENGTITYLLTSTLTRPTTISPTMVKECKLKVKEKIDVASIPVPKSQTVSLETVQKKKPLMQMKPKVSAAQIGKESPDASQESSNGRDSPERASTLGMPGSPAASDISRTSMSTTNMRPDTPIGNEAMSTVSGSTSISTSDKTIVAQTEVLLGACMPGDILPIKVSIDHTKPVKSMQGIIITLYRLARIDTHPAIPLGPSDADGNSKFEHLYPRSRTGLGGLSLSTAGSSRTFRQDLAQNITPLIIDPQSLTAIIKTSVQVPDNAFPSIDCVPGAMISFKYFVEIVIDLRGKLGQDRLLPKFSITNPPQHGYGDARVSMTENMEGITYSTTPGFNFLITDPIRRRQGVVSTRTEIVIGTCDSTKSRSKQEERQSPERLASSAVLNNHQAHLPSSNGHSSQDSSHETYPRGGQILARAQNISSPPTDVDEPVDEKERIRRAEQALLPSAPPRDEEASFEANIAPSAPYAYDEEDLVLRYGLHAPAPAYEGPSSSSRAKGVRERSRSSNLAETALRREHTASSNTTHLNSHAFTGDDEQELERQRSQGLASAPDIGPVKTAPQEVSYSQQTAVLAPSAPTLFANQTDDNLSQLLDSGGDICMPGASRKTPSESDQDLEYENSEHLGNLTGYGDTPEGQGTQHLAPMQATDNNDSHLTHDAENVAAHIVPQVPHEVTMSAHER